MDPHLFLVLTAPVDGGDDAFNDWYDTRHLPDVLDVPGFTAARRYRITEAMLTGGLPDAWRYVAIYEMDCDDPQRALTALRERIGTPRMQVSDTLDRTRIATFVLAPLPAR
jgi:hypothetical protein